MPVGNWQEDLKGRSCAIIGSAPDVKVALADVRLGANAGAKHNASFLFTTAYLFRENPSLEERKTIKQLKDTYFDTILVDTTDAPALQAYEGCNRWKIDHRKMIDIPPRQRFQIVFDACGEPLGTGPTHARVSTGLFAACAAVVAGARKVILCGISLKNGNFYSTAQPLRQHVPADARCLTLLQERHGKILWTNCKDISKLFGIQKC